MIESEECLAQHATVSIHSVIRCKREKCSRVFSDVNVFKRHLFRVHKNDRDSENGRLERQTSVQHTYTENDPAPALLNPICQPIDLMTNDPISVGQPTSITPREFAGSV